MPNPTQHKVAFSYSWKEETEGVNAGAVDKFCAALQTVGIKAIRDCDRLKHGERISEFMQSISASDFLCVFLSDAYLKSPNCMYELLVAWQRRKDNPAEFLKRVKVCVMPGSEGIHKPETRLSHLKYWRSERDRLTALIQEVATDGLAAAELESFRRIKEFAEHVNEILCFFADTLLPGSAKEFQTWILAQFPNASAELTDEQYAEIYTNTVKEIERILNRQPTLRQFLSDATPGLIHEEAARWKLAAAVKSRRFDICTHFEKIVECLDSFQGQPGDWKALGEVAGGLVVLAIDREWVLRQRDLARLSTSDYPGDDEAISLDDGRLVNLLHLAASALADGRARLEKVFGKPPLDKFRAPDAAKIKRGISQADHHREVKLHFIRFVLGPDRPIDENNPKQIEILFTRTKQVISAAFKDDHTAFFATGEEYKRLTVTIREHLKIEDLLLIHHSGDDPELLLTDYVRVLRFLGKIFDAVQAHAS